MILQRILDVLPQCEHRTGSARSKSIRARRSCRLQKGFSPRAIIEEVNRRGDADTVVATDVGTAPDVDHAVL